MLALISIFAAIAVARQPSTNVTLKAQKTALMSHIRYAQMRSMNSDSQWGVAIDSNNNHVYWLFENDPSQQRLLPGEDNLNVDLTAKGITLSAAGTDSFRFDEWGRPISGGSFIAIDLNVSLQKNQGTGTITEAIIITSHTGFVI